MVETKFNNYEIMFIVDDQNPEKANLIKKEFVEILTKNNGKITKEEDFIHQFAYKINHKSSGHYFVLQLTTTSENIADFNRIFSIKQKQGDVVRKLVINLDDEKINTFKERKESPKKPEFNRDQNRESRVRTLDNPNFKDKPYFDRDKKVETKFKKEKIENSSEVKIKENTEDK